MSPIKETANILAPEILAVVEKLIPMLKPHAIYLYNHRVGASGESTAFKLCVVAPMEDKQEVEQYAYLEIDSEIPFDLLLYTPEEWQHLTYRDSSFAHRIQQTGTKLYG